MSRTSLGRWVNVVAGAWLVLSAGLLRAPAWQRVMQGGLGMLVFLVAFVAMAYARFRRINTMLALFIALCPFLFALPASAASLNLLVSGLVVLTASLWPSRRDSIHDYPAPR